MQKPVAKWSAFPSFDISDAMLYFPSTFARLIAAEIAKNERYFQGILHRKSSSGVYDSTTFIRCSCVRIYTIAFGGRLSPPGWCYLYAVHESGRQSNCRGNVFQMLRCSSTVTWRLKCRPTAQYKWMDIGQQRTPLLIRNMRMDTKSEFSRNQAASLIES